MAIWLIIGGVYALFAGATLIGILVAFFRKHPDGAPDLSEKENIEFVAAASLISAAWPVFLVLILYIRARNPKRSA